MIAVLVCGILELREEIVWEHGWAGQLLSAYWRAAEGQTGR